METKQYCNLEVGERFKFVNGTQVFVKMLRDTYKAVGSHKLMYNGEPVIYDMVIPFRDVEVISNDDGPIQTNQNI